MLRRFDYILFLATLGLLVLGIVLIYSATLPSPGQPASNLEPDGPVIRQAIYALVGLALVFLVGLVDYRILEEVFFRTKVLRASIDGVTFRQRLLASFLHPFYLLNLGLLIVVFLVGRVTHGSQRWINLGIFDLQPSELAKLLIVITLAKYLADQEEDIKSFRAFAVSLIHVALPISLVYLQPDLGTAFILGVIWLGMVILAGVRFLYLAALAMPMLLAAPLVWVYVLRDYQRQRLFIFLNPYLDPLGSGYNLIQSLTSVGSGGLLGKGLTAGTQSQLHFLRIQHTDYIFSVLGEEMGFVGAVCLLALLGILLSRILTIAARAPDAFGQLLASGIAIMIFSQSFINIGMNIGLLPVTGIPLPFISYGGSSLITLLLAEGLVQSIAMHPRRLGF